MGKALFYALWSLSEAPRQFISKSNRLGYQMPLPLPLPKQLVVFSLGEWNAYSNQTSISVEVSVGQDIKPQMIGTLSPQTRCLIWEGDWRVDLLTVATEKAERGVYGKVLLTVCGEASFSSSTPVSSRKRLAPHWQPCQQPEAFSSMLDKRGSQELVTPNCTALEESRPQSVSLAELEGNATQTEVSTLLGKSCMWPTDKIPRRTVMGTRGQLASPWNPSRTSSPRKRTRCTLAKGRTDEEKNAVRVKKRCRAVCPSRRWCHAMCLSDAETAVVIGGESAEQERCTDSLWKLEIDSDFWFPMNSSGAGPAPPCSRGHSATYDPESRAVYVYGGLKDDQRHSDMYILDTLTWKWKLIIAKGNIPALAYHSATIYRKELFVFGGVQPSRCPGGTACSNSLYIFNPEFQLWYQPIVEGDRPMPRFGHSTTLMSNKLLIFGGRKTAAYLNDLHILDLGFMEYSALKCENMPPLPRGFHAAVPLSGDRMLISGGCSAIGALQDVHFFSLETASWTSVTCPALSASPRAGHSVIRLAGTLPPDTDVRFTLLVFGGSDCTGTFYGDTFKCTLEIPAKKRSPNSEGKLGQVGRIV